MHCNNSVHYQHRTSFHHCQTPTTKTKSRLHLTPLKSRSSKLAKQAKFNNQNVQPRRDAFATYPSHLRAGNSARETLTKALSSGKSRELKNFSDPIRFFINKFSYCRRVDRENATLPVGLFSPIFRREVFPIRLRFMIPLFRLPLTRFFAMKNRVCCRIFDFVDIFDSGQLSFEFYSNRAKFRM